MKKIKKGLLLDLDKNQIVNMKEGTITSIEPRLAQILNILLRNRGSVVSRETLIHAIWGNYNSGPTLLTHSISMLRKTIGKDSIVTIPKMGYIIHLEPSLLLTDSSILKRYYPLLIVLGFVLLRLVFPMHH